jgi:hypothetical protein
MKKALLTIGIILVALSVMAPDKEKAEKLRIDDQGWDSGTSSFVLNLSCQFGMATAAENSGKFTIRATIDIFDHDGNSLDTIVEEGLEINKVEGADKDTDHYVKIEPLELSWDRNGDIFEGVVSVTASASLVGPSGNVQGDAVVSTDEVLINHPSYPSVKINDEGWDYDPVKKAIVVPLLVDAKIVDFLIEKDYQVEVDVDVWNIDADDNIISPAGFGEGSATIEVIPGQGGEYVQILPVLAVLDDGVSWNGDDDGSGLVSGKIKIFSELTTYSITSFMNQIVGFVIPCEDCGPGDS